MVEAHGNAIENYIRTFGAGGNIFGGDGNDTLDASVSPGAGLYGEAGNDVLLGGDLSDAMFGGTGDDTMNGNNGSDQFYLATDAVPYGHDVIDGGAGFDWLHLSEDPAAGAASVNLAAGTVTNAQGSASVTSIEAFFGTRSGVTPQTSAMRL